MVPVARRNLLAEKGRFAMSIGGVTVSVLLVLVVLALYRGFSRTGETFELLPGELWVTQAGATDPFHSLSLVREDDLQTVQSISGVAAVVPVLVRQMSFSVDGRVASARLLALDMPASALPPSFADHYLPPRGVMLVDAILAAKEGLHEGHIVDAGSRQLRVGKVQPRSAEAFEPFAFVNYQDAQEIFGIAGIVNFGMVMLEPGADAAGVGQDIEAANPAVDVFTRKAFARAIRKEIDESFLPIIGILLVIGFSVGSAVVGLTIYTGIIERSREFGVMKAVGASGAFLYRIVLSQSTAVTLAGFAGGLIAALLISRLAREAAPDFSTEFRVSDVAAVFLGTLVMAFAASLLPVRRINSIDPAMVFKA